ncbi:Potassium-transporting ATPase KdpC subunit [Frankliniella fusca]|uniref:Potassium-transporting ATPase KdpC subunit n=1 Tax=Frankliniella fusca TaxID=407009 RepID=A0AAE1LDC1_9NEOP|nr:Potassium-transporting ATPase KdpC subunit [Frankliniella fusca]
MRMFGDIAMRKYQQLLLVVVSAVSVVALLFYHHEYHRLRYVLEVLNFFGKPAENLQCPTINETSLSNRVNGFSSPLPVWVSVGDNHYVYSAFWERNNVIIVGTGPANGGFSGRNSYQCEVWLEGKDEPIPGRIHAYIIEGQKKKKVGFSGYTLSCEIEKLISVVPEEVTMWRTEDKVPAKVSLPIHHMNVRRLEDDDPALSLTVCVLPDDSQRISSNALISFVSYYSILGVSDFILYGGSRYHHVAFELQKHGASVSVIPWNFPVSGDGRSELERDCRSRGWPATGNIVVLSLNEYIVPVIHNDLLRMLDDLDAGRKTTSRFQFSTQLFCTNIPDDPGAEPSWPIFMHKTYYDPAAKTGSVNIYRPGAVTTNKPIELSTYTVSPSIAAVHKLSSCDIPPGASTDSFQYKPNIRRFVSELMKSGLLNVQVEPRK